MVDLALLRTAVSYVAPQIAEAEVLGQVRPIIGNRAAYVGPSDLFRCKAGWVMIATLMNSLWRRLLKVIGHEELLDDPELSNDFKRYEHRDRVDPLVAEWTAERTVEEVMEKCLRRVSRADPIWALMKLQKTRISGIKT